MEFSKSDKKIARELIKQGMMVVFEKGMAQFHRTVNKWETHQANPQEAFHELYKQVINFNKAIARRYDDMSNSILHLIIVQQINEGLISEKTIDTFSEEGKKLIGILRTL